MKTKQDIVANWLPRYRSLRHRTLRLDRRLGTKLGRSKPNLV